MLPNFELTADNEVVHAFRALNLFDFHAACTYVQNLPYGRNAQRGDFLLVLSEGKGTCSSKHGLLGQLAEMHEQMEIHLMVGIFLMSGKTHPKVIKVLSEHGLEMIPEAHAYFRFEGKRYDFTSRGGDIATIEPYIVREQRCEPNQLTDWKPMIHQHYLQSWLKRQQLSYSPEALWKIREACIASL